MPELETTAPAPAPAPNYLGFLLPGYIVWEWECFSLPEMACSECVLCLQWHNNNATRMPDAPNVAVKFDLGVKHQHVYGGRPPRAPSVKTLLEVVAERSAASRCAQ
jgi:hypothetical protein